MNITERDRKAGVGCVIVAGFLGLVPALLIGGMIVWSNAQSVFGSIQFSSFAAFWSSILSLIRWRSGSGNFGALVWLIVAGYVVLFSQWVAVALDWRTLVSTRRVWAISSGYFAGVMIILITMEYGEFRRLEGQNVDFGVGAALTWGILICMFPASFLSITVPLWLATPRAPADPSARSH